MSKMHWPDEHDDDVDADADDEGHDDAIGIQCTYMQGDR